jgi:hypothetical protein
LGGHGPKEIGQKVMYHDTKTILRLKIHKKKIPVTKTWASKPQLISATTIVASADLEGKRTERFSEKSLNLENSLKSEVRLPSTPGASKSDKAQT